MSRASHAAGHDAQARAEARRALKATGTPSEDALAGAARLGDLIKKTAEPLVFDDQVHLGTADPTYLIDRARLVAALDLLGVTDIATVIGVQIDTNHQVTVVRRRHPARADGGHLTRDHIPIDRRTA